MFPYGNHDLSHVCFSHTFKGDKKIFFFESLVYLSECKTSHFAEHHLLMAINKFLIYTLSLYIFYFKIIPFP